MVMWRACLCQPGTPSLLSCISPVGYTSLVGEAFVVAFEAHCWVVGAQWPPMACGLSPHVWFSVRRWRSHANKIASSSFSIWAYWVSAGFMTHKPCAGHFASRLPQGLTGMHNTVAWLLRPDCSNEYRSACDCFFSMFMYCCVHDPKPTWYLLG